MSIKRRQNWLGQQRVDAPHLKSVESAVSNDFDELVSGVITGGPSNSYVIRGLKINMPGSIGSSANGLQLIVEDSAFLHGASNESGTFYTIPTGTPAEILSSTTNERVQGSFTPNTNNYIGIEFVRQVDDSTTDQVYFWNPTTNVELTKTVPLAIIMDYKIVISTSSFGSNVLPIAVVQTDSSNNVVEIEDRRPLFNRLATAGDSEPNPFYEYEWPESQVENFYSSTSSTLDPFSGGDKALGSLKEWQDAVMTEIKRMKGSVFWYSPVTGSIARVRQDVANTAITGKGGVVHGTVDFQGQVAGMTTDIIIKTGELSAPGPIVLVADSVKDVDTLISDWNAANPDTLINLFTGDGTQVPTADITLTSKAGQLNWNSNIYLNFIGGRLRYQITKNEETDDLVLADNEVAYIKLVRDENVIPNLVFTQGSSVVTSVGSANWTNDLQPGDFIKDASKGDEFYYEILTVDSLFQVTLTEAFAEDSSGTSGFDAKYAFGVYETNPSPSTDRHIQVADRADVPFAEDYFWMFFRQDDDGSVAKVYAKVLGGQELQQGESQDISDNTSLNVLQYIGSASESDNDPNYTSLATDALLATSNYNTINGENLTVRASHLTSMVANKAQDKTIKLVADYSIVSVQDNQNPSLEFTIPTGTVLNQGDFIVGLQDGPLDGTDLTSITSGLAYAIQIENGTDVQIWEGGTNVSSFLTSASDGDVFTISVESNGTVVNYYQNGSLIYTSLNAPTFGYSVAISIFKQAYGPQNVVLNDYPIIDNNFNYTSNGTGSYSIVSGNNFVKTSADGWDNIIASDELILGGDFKSIGFTGGSGTANIIIPSSSNNGTIGLTGHVSLEQNQAAYYIIDRNAPFSIADLNSLNVDNLVDVPLTENIFVFAYRLGDDNIHLWNDTTLGVGDAVSVETLRQYLQQNNTAKLIKGGTWDWNLTANSLTSSASSYIQVAGLADTSNEIAAQSVTLDADGKVAYVEINRLNPPTTLTVQVADISAINLSSDDVFIIARRVGDDVIVGTNSVLLKDREYLEIDGALAEINRYNGQLIVNPEVVPSSKVLISGADILKLNGSKLILQQKKLILEFEGAVIDFATGEIFEADGTTPFNGGANDFTPNAFTPASSEYFFYSVSLAGDAVDPVKNTITPIIEVLPGTASNAVFDDTPRPEFGGGVGLASIYVQENGIDGGILDITYGNIDLLKASGGGGGADEESINRHGIFPDPDDVIFIGQHVDEYPVIDPALTDGDVVWYNEANSRYEKALAGTFGAQDLAIGIYNATHNVVAHTGPYGLTHGEDPYTPVYLSDSAAGTITLNPTNVTVGYTLDNRRIMIDFNREIDDAEVVDPDGDIFITLESSIKDDFVLEAPDTTRYRVTLDDNGVISTVVTTDDLTSPFKITKPDTSFAQIKVENDGTLFIESPPLDLNIITDDKYYIKSPSGIAWKFLVDDFDQLTTTSYNNLYMVRNDAGLPHLLVKQIDQQYATVGIQNTPEGFFDNPDDVDEYTNSLSDYPEVSFLIGNNISTPVGEYQRLMVYQVGSRFSHFAGYTVGDTKVSALGLADFQRFHDETWVLCNGVNYGTGTDYYAITGNTTIPNSPTDATGLNRYIKINL